MVGRARAAGLVAASVAWSTLAFVASAVLPYLLGRAVDTGLEHGVGPRAVAGCAAAARGRAGRRAGQRRGAPAPGRGLDPGGVPLVPAARPPRHPHRRRGHRRAARPGEVVATVASDSLRVGEVFWIMPRLVGALASYAVVAVLLLRTSVALGVAVLVGLPAVAGVLALVVRPLSRPPGRPAARPAAG